VCALIKNNNFYKTYFHKMENILKVSLILVMIVATIGNECVKFYIQNSSVFVV